MGIKVGRIVKEFVFKSLVDQGVEIQIHGTKKELTCKISEVDASSLYLDVLAGDQDEFLVDEQVRIFFFFQNNYHTFESTIQDIGERSLKLSHPEGVYKNPQRKYERIRLESQAEVFFAVRGKRVDLNFPKSNRFVPVPDLNPAEDRLESLKDLYTAFQDKTSEIVSNARILMMRNKLPERYEERIIAALGKILWIPSVEEDFPFEDPFPNDRIITKRDLVKYEESFDRPAHVITGKLGNILYEKQKRKIFSEVYCPILYDIYLVGYLYLVNRDEKRIKISAEMVDYVFQYAQVMSHALHVHGYFTQEAGGEQRLEGSIIDMSAAGLMFAYPNMDLMNELHVQTDLDVTVRFTDRRMTIGARVRRKFNDDRYAYFGLQFLKIDSEDLHYLFSKLYGKPFSSDEEELWEGGLPPPELNLFEE